jgi:hypothetical protein
MKTELEKLLDEIDAFQKEYRLRDRTLGRLSNNSPALILRLKTGSGNHQTETLEKVRKFMADVRANHIALPSRRQKKHLIQVDVKAAA